MTARRTWSSGEEWQSWANQLLSCHHSPTDYQKVPDNDKGDAGIEGFSISEGIAYQAYSCEGELSTTERYKKQRDKITKDINKFINNRPVLEKIFGAVKISRWVLLVPFFDSKDIVSHASKKTDEVLAAQLPYITDSFRIMVCQEDDFPIALDKLLNASTDALLVDSIPATPEQITEWVSEHVGLAATLEDKLRKLPTLQNYKHRHRFHEDVLKWYLDGQSILDELRKYPVVYEKVLMAKYQRERYLAMSTASDSKPQGILSSSIQSLLEDLQNEVGELHNYSARALAHEAVADWLLRCPLDFPEVA